MRRHIPQRMMEDTLAQRNRTSPPRSGKTRAAFSLTHPNAAGIDIGSASHYVAVPPDRDDEPVREFQSFTADLHRLDILRAAVIQNLLDRDAKRIFIDPRRRTVAADHPRPQRPARLHHPR